MEDGSERDHEVVALRALVIAAEVVLGKLRDPAFLALTVDPAPSSHADRAPAAGGAGGGWRALARQGGERARQGLEKWSAQRPGTPHWETLSVEQRCDGWVATLGRASAVLAALPGFAGVLGEVLPVGDLVSVGGQGLLLCAIAQEHGLLDRDDQVELLGAVVLGRELSGTAGRAQRRRAQDDAGGLVLELTAGPPGGSSAAMATGAALVRMGRSVRSLQGEADPHASGRGGRGIAGVVPVLGALGDYRTEREALVSVAERGRTWCRARAEALGIAAVIARPARPAPPAPTPLRPDADADAITVSLHPDHDVQRKGTGMEPAVGTKVKDKHARAWLETLAPRLHPGEVVTAVSRTNMLKPVCDGVVVTNARVLAFASRELGTAGVKREVLADDIARADIVKKTFGANTLMVTTRSAGELSFGDIPAADQEMVLGIVRHLGLTGIAPDVRAAVSHQAQVDRQSRDAWSAVSVVGTPPTEKAWKVLKDHCSPGEVPWFVVGGAVGAGVLAALGDRLIIAKVGAMTSLVSGSFGGGRVTTFPYTEITGIEYNAGLLSGVLEVLTPSYSGTSNKDYWRGTFASRNANADDPWTLSNTLPMPRDIYQQALPRLNEMRARIAEAKRPQVVIAAPQPALAAPPAPASVADELGKLAGLRDQGVLSDAEFQNAKQRVLAQHGLA